MPDHAGLAVAAQAVVRFGLALHVVIEDRGHEKPLALEVGKRSGAKRTFDCQRCHDRGKFSGHLVGGCPRQLCEQGVEAVFEPFVHIVEERGEVAKGCRSVRRAAFDDERLAFLRVGEGCNGVLSLFDLFEGKREVSHRLVAHQSGACVGDRFWGYGLGGSHVQIEEEQGGVFGDRQRAQVAVPPVARSLGDEPQSVLDDGHTELFQLGLVKGPQVVFECKRCHRVPFVSSRFAQHP